jgi:hypothetical protein
VLGAVLYAAAPSVANAGYLALFVLMVCVILSMYGGGFATIPAYLSDIFGTQFVGAIHGRLLTAWSTAGVVGPLLIGLIRQEQLDEGVSQTHVYDITLYVLAGFLVAGFIANALVRPVAAKWLMKDSEVAALQAEQRIDHVSAVTDTSFGIGRGGFSPVAALTWLAVGVPILWGIWVTIGKALVLFT